MAGQAASCDMQREGMLPPGRTMSGRCFSHQLFRNIRFQVLLLTAWHGPGLRSGVPRPRKTCGEVAWYSGRGSVHRC